MDNGTRRNMWKGGKGKGFGSFGGYGSGKGFGKGYGKGGNYWNLEKMKSMKESKIMELIKESMEPITDLSENTLHLLDL